MRRVLTSEILSASMERRFHGRQAEEADHLVRFDYNQCNAMANRRSVDVRHVARHFCGNMIRRLVFSKRYFAEPPLAPSAGAGPGPDEVEHVNALFTLLNYVYSFCISDYFPVSIGLDLDGHEKDSEGRPLLSLEEIKAQAAWALAEMMNKPEIMEKAMDELNTVVGKERLVQESNIPHLNYLKACIREAFRMHPYHPFNPPHVAMEDTTIVGYLIPKDSHVLISRVGLGRNPNIWLDPHEFQPERHLMNSSNVVLTEPGLRFMSFSTGRRGCPGVSLGSSVKVMLLARLLQGFSWTKLPGVQTIELKESPTSIALAEPLILQAEPRLPVHLYESI
ncbi:hypothetical protein SEVIR_9G183500v4 [Setaria viridis]|uniref:Tyrosine N-monooxygenase n=1 Tax=Setaria viridis TaxID=4556 RepID=A0A4U6SVA5_SETVI|nr:hypothetical protein SEVIR_9G183500v2 [Setaria viridis]